MWLELLHGQKALTFSSKNVEIWFWPPSLSIAGLGTSLHGQRSRQLPHPRLSPALHRPLQVLKFRMFSDLSPSHLLWNTCKQTPLTKTLNLFPLCAPPMFLILLDVSQTVVLWLKSVKAQSSDNVTNDWIFSLLRSNFKGLSWKDVIILLLISFSCSPLCSSVFRAREEAGYGKDCVKSKKAKQTCFWERRTEGKSVGDPKRRLSCLFVDVFSFLYR